MDKYYSNKRVMVVYSNGSTEETYLLSVMITDDGICYFVSGPKVVSPGLGEVVNLDGSPLLI